MTINDLFTRNTSEDDARAELIDKIANKLGFDPRTHDPQICWFWPGPFQRPDKFSSRKVPILRTRTGTIKPLRALMEYMERQPLPIHPHTKRQTHYVRPCEINHECVNPAHARVQRLRDPYECEIEYEQRHKFLFRDEMDELRRQCDDDLELIRVLAPLNVDTEHNLLS